MKIIIPPGGVLKLKNPHKDEAITVIVRRAVIDPSFCNSRIEIRPEDNLEVSEVVYLE